MNTKTPISFINTAAYLFLGIASMSPLAPRAAAQKTPPAPQDVRVVNTAAEPVPVKIDATTNTVKLDGTTNTVKLDGTTNTVKLDGTTNTVKIDGTTNTVKAAQNGAWSVNLATGSTVQI